MAITQIAEPQWHRIRITPDYIVDTYAEFEGIDLAPYAKTYIRFLDRDGDIYYVQEEYDRVSNVYSYWLRSAYDITNYDISDEPDIEETGSAGAGEVPIYIQPAAPIDPPTKYIWIQTQLDGTDKHTIWFHEGADHV